MGEKVMLTGIKPTGYPHLGNYIGAIKPALEMSKNREGKALYFIADYHALNAVQDPKLFREYTKEVAATWLSLGLGEDVIFYRQTEVPEILELAWILACLTPKGIMNRAHAYKAKVEHNKEAGVDIDTGVNMGLYTYPILMAADILLFQSSHVPVGKDQIQHIEITRDIATYFNNTFGETFTLPEYIVQEEGAILPGLDGRKMSKSYGNVIPLFAQPEKLKKLIFKIKTDSSLPNEPKEPETLFMLYKEFATKEEVQTMREQYAIGIGWGDVKKELFRVVNRELEEPREKYERYMDEPHLLYEALESGAERAREIAKMNLAEIKKRIGYDRER
ncbi:tryptophan--tRNA ligase [Bacillus sp. DX1.1]|uniref:tryptophan--tRNA ligase n=1 Tax=unclassified Bacillus (in: firmicutes) TaxID=185979 RepID=UPI002570C28F|nr:MULTISPECIES: tryptophan--tRNA ligase [unclassified Bacillus (in: firmicutes)]MDM5155515.1 tryptophan--tRNA ligase [Bacillus sp. DX1.1]WJE79826.1 tryptophan--tRNA ligase [Bacillus sp. DX3.1]